MSADGARPTIAERPPIVELDPDKRRLLEALFELDEIADMYRDDRPTWEDGDDDGSGHV